MFGHPRILLQCGELNRECLVDKHLSTLCKGVGGIFWIMLDNKHNIVPCPVGQDYALCYHTLWFAETHCPPPLSLSLSLSHTHTHKYASQEMNTFSVPFICIVKCGGFCNDRRQKLLFAVSYTCQNKAFSTDTEHKLAISSDFDARSSQKWRRRHAWLKKRKEVQPKLATSDGESTF